MSQLDVSGYYLRAMLLAATTSPRCARPSPKDRAAFASGAAYGLTHGLNFGWEMMRAAQDIAALTGAHEVQAFLGEALKSAQPEGFPLEPVIFEDDEQAEPGGGRCG